MKHILFFISTIFIVSSCSSEFNGVSPEEYIEQNNINATELSEGVYIRIDESGDSQRAEDDEVVLFDYRAILANTGETILEDEDVTAVYTNLIAGWQIGLREIGVGGSCTLIIPPSQAFGEREFENIPANSTLVFEVELKGIFSSTTVEGYIERNNLETIELDQGVHIVIIEPGNETKPNANSEVEVNYKGKLTNELVFDQGEGTVFNLSNLIEGWKIGLQAIGEGGKCILIIPAEAAYGEAGAGNGLIPPNSPIVFELELIKVGSAADDYVLENGLITQVLSGGVHIVIHDAGDTDKKPTINSSVVATYEGRLTDGTIFDSAENASFQLSGVIQGWQIGLQEIGEGGSCTLIIPPSAGYGGIQTGNIPPNSVLIFDVDMHTVI